MNTMGLHMNNTYSALFAYMFAPSAAMRRQFHEQYQRVSRFAAGCALIQIRAGDVIIHGERDLSSAQIDTALEEYTACARSMGGDGIGMYLMTDSYRIKEAAMQQLGGRMTTYTENASHFEDGYPDSTLLTVAGEVWVASRCVVTKGSGLGT